MVESGEERNTTENDQMEDEQFVNQLIQGVTERDADGSSVFHSILVLN